MSPSDVPNDVASLRGALKAALDLTDPEGRPIGNAKYGVYAFFDFDGEPIYVGQTVEQLRIRIGRHLTGRRSDSVAKAVLDPDEVAELEVWPFFDIEHLSSKDPRVRDTLARAEHTVFELVLRTSTFGAVLNEGEIPEAEAVELPPSYRAMIVPADLRKRKSHPDVRIARRAATIAELARQLSERKVSIGLRRTLHTQARRLEHLARKRLADYGAEPDD